MLGVKVAIFGATGALGGECLEQSLERGHEVTVLVRRPEKLDEARRSQVRVVQGDGLRAEDVRRTLEGGAQGILFAIGVDRASPEDLCTDVTRHILDAMPAAGAERFIWCGGGSTLVPEDRVTFGARFVQAFSSTFLRLRHRDKVHQLALLESRRDVAWCGVRPLQMRSGPRREIYRLGFDAFSGMSKISFADCAHAMLNMLEDDAWIHQAPIVQY